MKFKNCLKRMLWKFLTVKELMVFLWQNKLWWMIPMVLVFLVIGLLVTFAQSSAIVPFIYTLF